MAQIIEIFFLNQYIFTAVLSSNGSKSVNIVGLNDDVIWEHVNNNFRICILFYNN